MADCHNDLVVRGRKTREPTLDELAASCLPVFADALAAKDAEITALTKRTVPRLQAELTVAQERHIEALAENARLKALLEEAKAAWYAGHLCEYPDNIGCGKFDENTCAGCRARAFIAKLEADND